MIYNQNYNFSRTMCSDNKCLMWTIKKNEVEEERSLLHNLSTRSPYIIGKYYKNITII